MNSIAAEAKLAKAPVHTEKFTRDIMLPGTGLVVSYFALVFDLLINI